RRQRRECQSRKLVIGRGPDEIQSRRAVAQRSISSHFSGYQFRRNKLVNLFGMLEVSGSAMSAERSRAEIVSANMANSESTRTFQGGAYRRQLVVFRARNLPRFPLLLAHLHQQPAGGVQVEK